ncbi:MAG TPA: flagellar biosynthesis protein FliQ [Gammaproteobacteria bacterium]|nr:flagellar biosynthesis protein FliQ [Gammaproteobacteria bacterium]
MTPASVLDIFSHAMELVLLLVVVILVPALVVGLLVSMFQAATQINEMTLSFIPKLVITILTLMIAGPWMLRMLIEYTHNLILDIPNLIG